MSLLINLFSFPAVLGNLAEFLGCTEGIHLSCCSRDTYDVHGGLLVPLYAQIISTARRDCLRNMVVTLNKNNIVPNMLDIIRDKLKELIPSFVLDGTFGTSYVFEYNVCTLRHKRKFTAKKKAINRCFFDSWMMVRQVKINEHILDHYFTMGVKVRRVTTGDAIELNTYIGTFDYFGDVVDNMLTLSYCQCFDFGSKIKHGVSIQPIQDLCDDCMCVESKVDTYTKRLMHHKAESSRLQSMLDELDCLVPRYT